jgi:hypothetical protein
VRKAEMRIDGRMKEKKGVRNKNKEELSYFLDFLKVINS